MFIQILPSQTLWTPYKVSPFQVMLKINKVIMYSWSLSRIPTKFVSVYNLQNHGHVTLPCGRQLFPMILHLQFSFRKVMLKINKVIMYSWREIEKLWKLLLGFVTAGYVIMFHLRKILTIDLQIIVSKRCFVTILKCILRLKKA